MGPIIIPMLWMKKLSYVATGLADSRAGLEPRWSDLAFMPTATVCRIPTHQPFCPAEAGKLGMWCQDSLAARVLRVVRVWPHR